VAALCTLACASPVWAACKIAQLAELHVDRVNNTPLLKGQINGQPIRVLVDTGSYESFVAGGAARRLKLRLRDTDQRARGVNGEVRVQTAVIDHLQIDNFKADDMLLHSSGPKMGEDPNGIGLVLGADFFAHFSTEFDLGHGVIRLLKPQECKPEQLVYWDTSYFQTPVEHIDAFSPLIYAQVVVNGVHLRAVLDTGATISLISTLAARRANVSTDDAGVHAGGAVSGVSGTALQTWIGRFDTFGFGNETIRNAKLRIGNLFGADRDQEIGSHIAKVGDDLPEMILGEDFFLAHRMVVLPAERTAVFTYGGCPVFQVRRPDEQAEPDPPATPPTP